MNRPPVDCAEARDRLYELLDRELTADLEAAVRAHFDACPECYPVYAFETNFKRFLVARARSAGAPPALRRSIFDALMLGRDAGAE